MTQMFMWTCSSTNSTTGGNGGQHRLIDFALGGRKEGQVQVVWHPIVVEVIPWAGHLGVNAYALLL